MRPMTGVRGFKKRKSFEEDEVVLFYLREDTPFF